MKYMRASPLHCHKAPCGVEPNNILSLYPLKLRMVNTSKDGWRGHEMDSNNWLDYNQYQNATCFMEAMQLIVLAISISHHDNPCTELWAIVLSKSKLMAHGMQVAPSKFVQNSLFEDFLPLSRSSPPVSSLFMRDSFLPSLPLLHSSSPPAVRPSCFPTFHYFLIKQPNCRRWQTTMAEAQRLLLPIQWLNRQGGG